MSDEINQAKMDDLLTSQLTLTTSRQNILSSDVALDDMVYIYAIIFSGDGTARTVEIERQLYDDTWEMMWDNFHTDASVQSSIPTGGGVDLDNPIVTLRGGQNLSFIASAGAPECVILYTTRRRSLGDS